MPDPIYVSSIPTARFVFRISIVERDRDFAVFVHWWDNRSKIKVWVPRNPPRFCATLRGAKSSATQLVHKLVSRGYVVVPKPSTVK